MQHATPPEASCPSASSSRADTGCYVLRRGPPNPHHTPTLRWPLVRGWLLRWLTSGRTAPLRHSARTAVAHL